MRTLCALLILFSTFPALGQNILLIDDDAAAGYGNEFPLTMDRTGFTGYAVWSVADTAGMIGPTLSVLSNYDVVIWNQADFATTRGITEDDTAAMGAYLNQGGKLWLNANNFFSILLYYYGWTPPSWMPVTTYDLAPSLWLDTLYGVAGDTIGNGLVIPINRDLTTNDMESDTFSTSTATICFDHNVVSHSALRQDGYAGGGKLFFLAAPFEGIASDSLKDILFKRVMNWYGYSVVFRDVEASQILSPGQVIGDSVVPSGVFKSNSEVIIYGIPVAAIVESLPGEIIYADTVIIDSLAPGQSTTITFETFISISHDTIAFKIKSIYPQDVYPANDSLVQTLITIPGLIFSDGFEEGLENWSGDWGLTTEEKRAGLYSFTDTPYKNYYVNSDFMSYTSQPFNLTSFSSAELSFFHKYEIEPGYDFGYLMVSGDGGATWDSVASYTGFQNVWTYVEYDLASYLTSSQMKFGFRMGSDALRTYKGWFIDDLMIVGLPLKEPAGAESTGQASAARSSLRLLGPNPLRDNCRFSYQVNGRNAVVTSRVYNLGGQLVRTLEQGEKAPGTYQLRWDGRDSHGGRVSSGVYFLRMNIGGQAHTKQISVLR